MSNGKFKKTVAAGIVALKLAMPMSIEAPEPFDADYEHVSETQVERTIEEESSSDNVQAMTLTQEPNGSKSDNEYIDNSVYEDIEKIFPEVEDTESKKALHDSITDAYANVADPKNGRIEENARDILTFIDEIDSITDKYDVPLEVPVGTWLIEAGEDFSKASKTDYHVGPMQQSPHFALSNGVEINSNHDMRMHPVESVAGSVRHQARKYNNEYGRWDFVIMEYITGKGTVNSLITDYIEKHTGNQYANHQVSPDLIDEYDVSLIDIKQDEDVFYRHVNENDPIGAENYMEKVLASNTKMQKHLRDIGEMEIDRIETYEAQSGDYLSKIAEEHNVAQSDLEYYNHWIRTLQPGHEVLIPTETEVFNYSDLDDYFQ